MIDATVIIAAWRAQETLTRALESALDQQDVNLEVIVVDDASPDRTKDVAKKVAVVDSRVRVLCLSENSGPSAARNAGLAAAKGRWAAVLDADDAFDSGRLARMIALGEDRDADAVYDDFQPVDKDGLRTGPTHLAPLALTVPVQWDLRFFLAGCQADPCYPSLGYLKPILRLGFLREHRMRYDESLRNSEDFHLMAELLVAGGSLWVTPEAGYLYTVAAGSISSRLNPVHAQALKAADTGFLVRHAADLTPENTALIRRRIRRLGDLRTAELVLQSFRSGHPGGAISALVRRPQATGRLLWQSWTGLRRRLARGDRTGGAERAGSHPDRG